MIITQKTYFECIIPEQNKRAFYELIAGQDLFGFIIIRHWGRLGTKGQPPKQQRFSHEEDMLKEYDRVHGERIKHRYAPISKKDAAIRKKARAGGKLQPASSRPGRPPRTKPPRVKIQTLF